MRDTPILDLDPDTKAKVREGLHNLTTHERTVLAFLLAGQSRARVAVALRVRPSLLSQTLGTILRTLGVSSFMEAAVYVGAVEADATAARAKGILTHF